MELDYDFAPEAEFDLDEAYAWYESQRVGLGEDFLRRVDACLQSIRRRPLMYAIVEENYRRAIVRRFPYAIFYEYVDDRITIYAVFHSARDPNKWKQRLAR